VGRLIKSLGDNALIIVVILIPVVGILIYIALRGTPATDEDEQARENRVVVRIPSAEEEEEEGPRRVLSGSSAALARAEEVEREYALVVKEEDLQMPPLPEEEELSGKKADSASILELMKNKDYDGAYRKYKECIKRNVKAELNPQLECQLGEHFIRSGKIERAARILEHHVANHSPNEIDSETYFKLGYIHFRSKTFNKSRRFFRLFVQHHKDPAQVERAKKILERLEKVKN